MECETLVNFRPRGRWVHRPNCCSGPFWPADCWFY